MHCSGCNFPLVIYLKIGLDKIHHKKSTKRQIWASLPDVWLAAPWLVQAATGSLGLFRLSRSLKQKSRDHSIKTWTQSFTILTPTPLDWTIVDILHSTYPLFTWPCMDFLLTTCLPTYLPLLIHVVIEWPTTAYWLPSAARKLYTVNSLVGHFHIFSFVRIWE